MSDPKRQNLARRALGAYEVAAADGEAEVSLFASGSEVGIAIEARKLLAGRGIAARVVSVPCFEKFFAQDRLYREATIGSAPIKVGIEAAVRQGWDAIIGADGIFVGMTGFGASGPYEQLYEHFGINADAVVRSVAERAPGPGKEQDMVQGMRRRG